MAARESPTQCGSTFTEFCTQSVTVCDVHAHICFAHSRRAAMWRSNNIMRSATKPKPAAATASPPRRRLRHVGNIDDDMEEYFTTCNNRIQQLRQAAMDISAEGMAVGAPLSARQLYGLAPPEPTLDDVPGLRAHLRRQRSAELLQRRERASGSPRLPGQKMDTSSSTSRLRPLSAPSARHVNTAVPLPKFKVCNNYQALRDLGTKAPKLAMFFEMEAAAQQPKARPDMAPRPSSASRIYAPTANFHGVRPRTRSEPAPKRVSSLEAVRQLIESGNLIL